MGEKIEFEHPSVANSRFGEQEDRCQFVAFFDSDAEGTMTAQTNNFDRGLQMQ